MNKDVRDGKVAVLYSPGYGAGWYSWNQEHEELLFHPKLVEMVEAERQDEITKEFVKEHLNIEIYAGGARDLSIVWLPHRTRFEIAEYDGNESVRVLDQLDYLVA